MMVSVSYVYPNVSGITQRGGLLERWRLAENLECDYIEVPADLIKNQTEMEKTGLHLGDFLTEEAISKLYEKDYGISEELKYILHTEPSLLRRNAHGISYQAPLKWYDKEWREKFVTMTISISEFLAIPPAAIEIHPGDRRNSLEDIAASIRLVLNQYNKAFKVKPLILLENRTGQFISSGTEILSFWQFVSAEHADMKSKVGIVLDVQQLHTVTKKGFITEFEKIPTEALKGLHVHYKHSVPSLSNEVPWRSVFSRIMKLRNDIIINPEIHHKNKVKDAIRFCETMLA